MLPSYLYCPLSGEPMSKPVLITQVREVHAMKGLQEGETCDLEALTSMFLNCPEALATACSFMRNRTIEDAMEEYACEKLAERLPIAALPESDVAATVAAASGQILARHELEKWHDRARKLAIEPNKASLTALASILARTKTSWAVFTCELRDGKRPLEEKAAVGDPGSGSGKRRAVGGSAADAKPTPVKLDAETATDLVKKIRGTKEPGKIDLIVQTSKIRGTKEPGKIDLIVQTVRDGMTIIYLEVDLSDTVAVVKKKIQEKKKSFCTENQCLLLNGMQLEDGRTLEEY